MATSDDIVRSALRQFYRDGFHASGVDLLAEQAGVTKRTLYRYYPSKDALIDAALALRHQQFMEKMRAFVEAAPVESRPLAYIDFIIHWVQEDDFYGCAFINASAEYAQANQPPHQQAAAHKKEICGYLASLCAAAGAKQAEAVAMPLYLIGEGLIVACQVQGHHPVLLDAARALARSVTIAPS